METEKNLITIKDAERLIDKSISMRAIIKKGSNKKLIHIWEKYGKIYKKKIILKENEYELSIPVLESKNKFLNDLFDKYPMLSEKQLEYWNKLVDYYYNLTEEDILKNDQAIKDIIFLLKNIDVNLFHTKILKDIYNNYTLYYINNGKYLSHKQIALINQIKDNYKNQIKKFIINQI